MTETNLKQHIAVSVCVKIVDGASRTLAYSSYEEIVFLTILIIPRKVEMVLVRRELQGVKVRETTAN